MAILKHVNYVVDKHITGRKGEECLRNCHPNLFPELKNVNTVVVEQINFIFGKYKYSMRHMNNFRYYFFFYICADTHNEMLITNPDLLKQPCVSFQKKDKYAPIAHSASGEDSDSDSE